MSNQLRRAKGEAAQMAEGHGRCARHPDTLTPWRRATFSALLVFLLTACGGPAMVTPTPIPASVARPQQPTPVYSTDADLFSLATPIGTPQFVSTSTPSAIDPTVSGAAGERAAIRLFIENQTPSAVGIAAGGAAIFATRGGNAVARIPAGGVVTVTGKSADEGWYAVYTNDFAFGWISAGQLLVYGGDDLVVIDEALDPAPIATLLAQTARPVQVLDDLMATMEARSATPAAPIAQPEPLPVAESAPTLPDPSPEPTTGTAPVTGAIVSESRLNVRTTPDTAATILRKLDPGATVEVSGRTPTGDWLRVRLDDGSVGWVAAEFVELSVPADSLPAVSAGG